MHPDSAERFHHEQIRRAAWYEQPAAQVAATASASASSQAAANSVASTLVRESGQVMEYANQLSTAKSYTAIVLHTTPSFRRPDADPIVWEHGRRNMALVDAGFLSIVLPVNDDSGLAGFGIFALTPDDTATVMDADPGVRAGILTYDIHPVRGFPGSTLP